MKRDDKYENELKDYIAADTAFDSSSYFAFPKLSILIDFQKYEKCVFFFVHFSKP
jgi:hypothetical protein